MTAAVLNLAATRGVAIPCERPARDPELELERAVRFAVGCPGLARPEKVEWLRWDALGDVAAKDGPGALVVHYACSADPSLAELASRGPIEPSRAARWLVSLADTLSALHDLGVAHGHLRADLIQVSGDSVRVLGYGVEAVARAVGGAALAASALPERYCAAEQRGQTPAAASAWTDTFAFGVIAAEIVPRELQAGRVGELIEQLSSSSLARRPSDLKRCARELDEALRELAAAPKVALPVAEPPAAAPVPEPPAAPQQTTPEVVAPPPPPSSPPLPPAPVSQRGRSSIAWGLAMVAGLVLMVAGVGALFVIAVARRPAAAPPPVVTIGAFDAGAPIAPPLMTDAAAPPVSDGGVVVPPPNEDPGELPQISAAEIDPSRAVSSADAAAALPLDDQVPVWGDAQAPATLVVFGDLECPHTRRSLAVLLVLKRALGSDLRIAWRNRPLAGNELAQNAAQVAAAIHAEHGSGVFWRFVAEAAKDAEAPTDARLGRWIEAAGGERARVLAARAKHAKRVERDLELSGRFDVRSTPSFFLNGSRIEGYHPLSVLRRHAEQEIQIARVVLASGIESSSLYATRVRKNLIGLGPDVRVRSCPEIGTSPARGGSSPLVTIVEFSDFECPYCKRVVPTLERVLSRYGGDVRLVWKNLPLTTHARARPAAALAQEAYQRGGASSFWRIHDLLFSAGSLDDDGLKAIAGKAGLDPTSALDAVRRGDHDSKIEADAKLGKKLGAAGTPTFYLNGRKLEGAVTFERFSVLVQEEIDAAKRLIDSGTPRARIYQTVCGR